MNKSIPSNSVAVGVPCRVVNTIENYYNNARIEVLKKQKNMFVIFVKEMGCNPKASELWEEFIFFVDKRNIDKYPDVPVRSQLGAGYDNWLEHHQASFSSLEDFLDSID